MAKSGTQNECYCDLYAITGYLKMPFLTIQNKMVAPMAKRIHRFVQFANLVINH